MICMVRSFGAPVIEPAGKRVRSAPTCPRRRRGARRPWRPADARSRRTRPPSAPAPRRCPAHTPSPGRCGAGRRSSGSRRGTWARWPTGSAARCPPRHGTTRCRSLDRLGLQGPVAGHQRVPLGRAAQQPGLVPVTSCCRNPAYGAGFSSRRRRYAAAGARSLFRSTR